MSEKIVNEALAQAQAIHKAIAADAAVDTSKPEDMQQAKQEGEGVTLPDDPAILHAETDQWRQRYLALKGKYDAEVPRLAEQLRVAQAKVQELETMQLQAAKTTLDEALTTVREELGDKVADSLVLLTRQPNSVATPSAPAKPDLSAGDQGNNSQEHPYFAQVREMVDTATGKPGTFDNVNFDAAFVDYLVQTRHQPSGLTLKAFMEQRFGDGELADVARVFLSFVKKRADDERSSANVRKQGVAAPDARPGATTVRGEEKPSYTRAEYDATMKALNHDKKYRTPEGMATASKVRTELLEALRDGRIVG